MRDERARAREMKAIEAIKQLQELDPNEEIVIMYWRKELFDDNYDKNNQVSEEAWELAVMKLDDFDYLDGVSSNAHQVIEAVLNQE